MKVLELIEQLKAMPEKMEGFNSEGELVVLNTRKLAESLTETLRNCDIGTPEEQDKRFYYQFCRVGIEGCIRCKLNTLKHRGNTCGIHWAQMPYEEVK